MTPKERYPNLSALAQGCVSGRISEWPNLQREAEEVLAELAQEQENAEKARQFFRGSLQVAADDVRFQHRKLLAAEDTLAKSTWLEKLAQREVVAIWMIERGFATGHGDTLQDLLGELSWQLEERVAKAAEREKALLETLQGQAALRGQT